MDRADLRAPLPWFGGKSKISASVWSRFGAVRNYVEPFCGSCAMLLGRPTPFEGSETVNDTNGWLTNMWRSIQYSPAETAMHADWPVSELCLHARGDALFFRNDWYQARGYESIQAFIEWLRADPLNHDPLIAGWYVWGASCWIGDGWSQRKESARGVNRKRPHLHRGRGVHRSRPHLNGNMGVHRHAGSLQAYIAELSGRMRYVRICCGDWRRVCGPTPTTELGLTAVFLDPPYGVADRADCYDENDDRLVARDVRDWAIQSGENELMRIAYCGYREEGVEFEQAGWSRFDWVTQGGYGARSGNQNKCRESVWFSRHCIDPQYDLFGDVSAGIKFS